MQSHKLKQHHTKYINWQQTQTWCCALKLLMFRLCHGQRREYLAHLWPSALVTPTVTSPSCSSCTVALKSLCLASSCSNRTEFFQDYHVPRCKPQCAERGVMAELWSLSVPCFTKPASAMLWSLSVLCCEGCLCGAVKPFWAVLWGLSVPCCEACVRCAVKPVSTKLWSLAAPCCAACLCRAVKPVCTMLWSLYMLCCEACWCCALKPAYTMLWSLPVPCYNACQWCLAACFRVIADRWKQNAWRFALCCHDRLSCHDNNLSTKIATACHGDRAQSIIHSVSSCSW